MRRSWGVALACLLIAGCNNGVEGEALADAPTAPFDPCSIPADAIEATGLDPNIFESGWSEGVHLAGWTKCLWQSAEGSTRYFFEILASTDQKTDDLENNAQYSDLVEIQVDGHTWVQYRFTPVARNIQCGLAFDTASGVVTAEVDLRDGPSPLLDPCEMVLDHTSKLLEYFPAQT